MNGAATCEIPMAISLRSASTPSWRSTNSKSTPLQFTCERPTHRKHTKGTLTPVYGIAQLTITDREVYNRYQSRFMSVFDRYKGHVLPADKSPAVVEGKWVYQKLVLLSFPDEHAFRF